MQWLKYIITEKDFRYLKIVQQQKYIIKAFLSTKFIILTHFWHLCCNVNQNQPPLKLFFNQVDSASVICFIHGFQCYSALEERLPLILLTLLLVKGITYVMSKSNVTSRSAYVC